MFSEITAAFRNMDFFVWTIFILWALGTVVMIERFIKLQFAFNLNFSKFLGDIKKMVKAEDMDRAISRCRNMRQASLPLISLRALEAAETDPSTVKGTIEEETINFLPQVETRIGVLPAMATLIMLVGVLGTVDALFAAFHSIDVLDTAQKQASVGHGIAASLGYTAFGLIVCMYFLMGHQYLRGKATNLIDRVHHGVAVLNNLLVPAEMAFVPMAGVGGGMVHDISGPAHTGVSEDSEISAVSEPAIEEEASNDDDFDDASVEDIKDEEEII